MGINIIGLFLINLKRTKTEMIPFSINGKI